MKVLIVLFLFILYQHYYSSFVLGQCSPGEYKDECCCQDCPVGTYSGGGGFSVASCYPCSAGYYLTESRSDCAMCSAGTYSGARSEACTDCSPGTYSSDGSSACSNCPAGKYSNSRASSCTNCPTGTYSTTSGSGSCTQCSAGTYSSATGASLASTCQQCSAGTYSSAGGSSSCTSCAAGYYSTSGSSSCTQCAAGTYSNSGASSCSSCPAGTYSTPGSSSCLQCLAGTFAAAGSGSCATCSAGSYSAAGSSSCSQCLAGQYSISGSASCSNCLAGQYSNVGAGSCTNCGAGYYSTSGSSSCTQCGSGTFSSAGSSSCSTCAGGTYSTGGASSCSQCLAGSFSSTGSASCTQCSAGTYSPAGSSACSNCPAGQYSNIGSASCTNCQTGTYSTTAGSSGCTQCSAGTYSSATGASLASTCQQCGSGTYSSAGSSSCSQCLAGQYSSAGSASCTNCLAGSYSAPGSSACSQCLAGSFSASGSGSCSNCPAGQYSNTGSASCTNCPTGTYSTTSASGSCTQCSAGTYSSATGASLASTCQQCGSGTYSSAGSSSCSQCSAGFYSTTGSGSCLNCLAGQYSNSGAGSCTNCEAGSYSTSGSSTCQQCNPGSFSLFGSALCTPCGAGTFSASSGSGSCTQCPTGTYSIATGASSSLTCKGCPIGTFSNVTGASFCFDCPAGTNSNFIGSTNCTQCTGSNCNDISCGMLNNCTGNGVCIKENSCLCYSNWTSTDCSIPICFGFNASDSSNVCSGRGICLLNNTCLCREGYNGVDCRLVVPFTISLNSSYITLSITKIFSIQVLGNNSAIGSYSVNCLNCSSSFLNFTTGNSLITINMTTQIVGKYAITVVATMNNLSSSPSYLIVEILPSIIPSLANDVSFGFIDIPMFMEKNSNNFHVIISNVTLDSAMATNINNCGQSTCSLRLTALAVESSQTANTTLWTQTQSVFGIIKGNGIVFSPLVSIQQPIHFIDPDSSTLFLNLVLESSIGNKQVSSNNPIAIINSADAPTSSNFTVSPMEGQSLLQYFQISSSPWNAPPQIQPLYYGYGFYNLYTKEYIQLSPYSLVTHASIPLPFLLGGQVSIVIFVKSSLGYSTKQVIGQVSITKSIGNIDYSNLTDSQLACSVFDQSSQLTSTNLVTIIDRIKIDSRNPDSSLIYLNAISQENARDDVSASLISKKISDFLNTSVASYEQERLNLGYVKTKLSDSALNSVFSIISTVSSNSSVDLLLSSFSQVLMQSTIPKIISDNDMPFVSYSSSNIKAAVASFIMQPSSNLINNYQVNPAGTNFSVILNFTEISNNAFTSTFGLSIITFVNESKHDYNPTNQLLSPVTDFKYFQNYTYVKLRDLANPIILLFDVNAEFLSNFTNSSSHITCMYWEESTFEWSDEGCCLMDFDPSLNRVQCGCNHTTSFATFIDYNLSSIATITQKTQVSNLYYAQIAFGCLFAIISLTMLILLIIFRKHQPVSSRLLTPYIGMISLLVECLSIFIIQRSVLIDYLWSTSTDWNSGTNAPNVISNITTMIVNTLNITAIFCYVWQVLRYEIMKYLYDYISQKSETHSKRMQLLRRLTSKSLFITLLIGCLVLNLCYWIFWVILRRTEVITSLAYTQIISISYTVIILLFGAIISVIAIVDFVAAWIAEDIYFKRKIQTNNKILKDSSTSLEMQLMLIPHPRNKFIHTDAPLFFRSEMLAFVICFALMIVQQVTGLIVYSNDSSANTIQQVEVVNLTFQILYYMTFILVFGGFSLTIMLVYRGRAKKSSDNELQLVMSDLIGFKLFEVFCESEMSTENIYLYEMLKDNENITKGSNLKSLSTFIRTIFELFIQRNAKFEVNIPSRIGTNFKKLIQMLDSNQETELQDTSTDNPLQTTARQIFDDLFDQTILNLDDTFSRFCTLDIYEKYREKKGWKNNFMSQSNIDISEENSNYQ